VCLHIRAAFATVHSPPLEGVRGVSATPSRRGGRLIPVPFGAPQRHCEHGAYVATQPFPVL